MTKKKNNQNQFKEEFVNDFMILLQKYTGGCNVQHKGCPCRTCFFYMCDRLGLDDETQQKFWDVVLITRGDYTAEEIKSYREADD